MVENSLNAKLKRVLSFLTLFRKKKGKIDEETFFQLMRLKHLGVRIITCSLIQGRFDLPYNNSANMRPSMASYFYWKATFVQVCVRVPFKGSKDTGNPTVIALRRLYNAKEINKKKGESKCEWKVR